MEKISQPVRIFALVAALAALGGALFVFTQGRGGTDQTVLPVPPPAAPAKVAKASVTPKPKAPVKQAKAVAPAAKPAVKRAPKPAPTPALPPSGFPLAVDQAFRKHEVVVLSLVVPGDRVDELAAAEARAGAKEGGVGYLALNVLNEEVAHALLTKLEGLQVPSLLVVTRPGDIAVQLDGFVDRQTVAQAAANASS